jgi:hypothetical protein
MAVWWADPKQGVGIITGEAVPMMGPGTHRPWFSPSELASFKRPPHVVDFLDADATLELPHENLKRVIEIRLDVQEYQLP